MTFILAPAEGDDLQVSTWNWYRTLELLLASGVITDEEHEFMGLNGCGRKVDQQKALRIAEAVSDKLKSMKPVERVLPDLSVSVAPKKLAFGPDIDTNEIDVNELYSTPYEWLEKFAEFCRSSGGFEVM